MSEDSSLTALFQGTILIILGTILREATSFLGQVLAIRSLSPTLFGEIILTMSIVGLVGRLSLIGIPTGVTRLVSSVSERGERAAFIQSGYLIVLLTGLITIASLVLLREPISQLLDDPAVARLLPLFSLYILWLSISRVGLNSLRAFKQSTQFVIANTGGNVIALLVFIGFLYAGSAYSGAVVYYVFAPLFIAVISLVYLGRTIPKITQLSVEFDHISRLVNFSWPLALQGVFLIFMTSIDMLMIGYFLASDDVGLYGAVRPVAMALLLALNAFNFLYLPVATEHFEAGDYDRLDTLFSIVTKWMSILAFPAALLLVVYPENVIQVIYTQEYVPAAMALAILAIGIYLRVFVGPNGATIQAIDRTKVNLISSAIGTVVNVVLNLVLIPIAGIAGAAVATSVGFAVYNGVELLVIYRTVGIRPFSRNTIKPLLVSTIVLYGASRVIQISNLIELAVVFALFAVTVLVSVPLTRSVEADDITVFRGLMGDLLPHRLSDAGDNGSG